MGSILAGEYSKHAVRQGNRKGAGRKASRATAYPFQGDRKGRPYNTRLRFFRRWGWDSRLLGEPSWLCK